MQTNEPGMETLLAVAVEIGDESQREAYLEQVCVGDAAQLAELQSMVHDYFAAGSLLDRPAAVLPTGEQTLTDIGRQIGPYKLRELLGEGGMGSVYVAEQEQPVRRKVALKLIKSGMDSREVIARFEAERQALALMDHPHIAKVLDAGTTETGRPYFVMELVKGLPITEHCDAECLGIRDRLQLFLQVCQAIQHAHQKAIIHRDLKPSNIIVAKHDTTPVVKVIDFGVAKAIGQQLTDHSLYTGISQLIGTPLYMSPEQAGQSSLDVDTRSDVYGLGVLLYELLTGSTPFENETLKRVGVDEMRRMIREVDPPLPSARVSTMHAATISTISQQRQIEPRQLRRELRGDLDWIVMKAIEKDRGRRYESASALAIDVQRSLNDEPVLACPPSAVYRLGKFARRNRGRLVASILLGTLGVVTASTWAVNVRKNIVRTRQAEQEVRLALTATETALEVGDLALASRLAAEAKGRLQAEQSVLPDLATSVRRVQEKIKARQADESRFQQFLKLTEEAQEKMGYGQGLGGDSLAVEVLALYGVEAGRSWLSRLEKSQLSVEQRQQVREAAYVTLVSLADYHVRWQSSSESVQRSQELLEHARAFHEPTRAFYFVLSECHRLSGNQAAAEEDLKLFQSAPARTAWDMYLPGHTAGWRGNLKQAIEAYQAALRIQPTHFNSLFFSAMRLYTNGNPAEAAQVFRACQALRPDHVPTLANRAQALGKLGEHAESLELINRVVALKPNFADTHLVLGNVLSTQGKLKEAMACYRKAIELRPNYKDAHNNLGNALFGQGKLDDAIASYRQAIELDPKLADAYNGLGNALSSQGKTDDAITCYRQAIELDPKLADAYNGFGDALSSQGKLDDAIASYRQAIQFNSKIAHYNLGNALLSQGKLEVAMSEMSTAVQLDPDDHRLRNGLAWQLVTVTDPKLRQPAQAVEHAMKAVEQMPNKWDYLNTLGVAHYRNGAWQEAVTALNKSEEIRRDGRISTKLIMAMAHWQLGEQDESRRWYERAVEWLTKHPADDETNRFRAEAEELMGIAVSDPKAKTESNSSGEAKVDNG